MLLISFNNYGSSTISIVETYSEAVKILKGEYVIQALEEHKMDKALIFCRTKLDCDNLEKYLQQRGGGKPGLTGKRLDWLIIVFV